MKTLSRNVCVVTLSANGRSWELVVDAEIPEMALSYIQTMIRECAGKELHISVQPVNLGDKGKSNG